MFFKSAKYIYEWYRNPARSRKKVALPTVLNYPITDNCNSRCVMCDIWKERSENELSSQDLKKILGNKLFSKVRHVGISGGEPSLITDIADYVEVITNLPKIESLSITTHAFLPNRWKRLLPDLKKITDENNVNFEINMSIDGIGEVHNKVRQIPKGFNKVLETYKIVKDNGIGVNFQSTISNANVYSCPTLLQFATKMNTGIIFRQATEIARLYNEESMQVVSLSEHEKSFFKDFLESDTLATYTKNPSRRLFYKDLSSRLLSGNGRGAPCSFQREGILLSAHGDLYLCSISERKLGSALTDDPYKIYTSKRTAEIRENLLKEVCTNCYHDQTGSWQPITLIKESIGLGNYTGKVKAIKNILTDIKEYYYG